MEIDQAEFFKSSSTFSQCPEGKTPEFAFIGRSNVGKSSLINMLCNHKGLAKISTTPGKTQLINHFTINRGSWYLVDLPGYGFAKVSKTIRVEFHKMIRDYLTKRNSLIYTFVLVDSRHPLQKIDLEFINWMGECQLPFAIIFTKADKVKKLLLTNQIEAYKNDLLNYWEVLPPYFVSSSESKQGKEEILAFVEDSIVKYRELVG